MNKEMREAYRAVGIDYEDPKVVETVKPEAERRGVERKAEYRGKLRTMTCHGAVRRVWDCDTQEHLEDGWEFCPKSVYKAQRQA